MIICQTIITQKSHSASLLSQKKIRILLRVLYSSLYLPREIWSRCVCFRRSSRVCLPVCLLSLETVVRTSPNFRHMLPISVAWSFSSGFAIGYVICFDVMFSHNGPWGGMSIPWQRCCCSVLRRLQSCSQQTNWTELNRPAPSWPSYTTRYWSSASASWRCSAAVRELRFSSGCLLWTRLNAPAAWCWLRPVLDDDGRRE